MGNNLSETLALYKQANGGSGRTVTASPKKSMEERFVGSVEQLNETVYGKEELPGVSISQTGYNAKAEVERLKKGIPVENITKSKLPTAILESVISNPLINTSGADDVLDDFAKRLASSGINKSKDIMEKLDRDEQEAKTVNESLYQFQTKNAQTPASVDYEMIKVIVESAVEKKFSEMSGMLNESRNSVKQPNVSLMRLTDKLMFMDSDNNVYECKMIYKGKGGIRKK